ncbi:MAG: sugar phosphate nucleotidyltransferase [Candidatus Nanopelagicales bacterium]
MLVGGKGTRLRPLTNSIPKPMLPVAGVPVTEHQIARAREAGVSRIVLGTSYRAEVFSAYFGDGSDFGVELRYVVEDEPLGTGGAIRNVAEALESGPDDPVIIFNGDVLTGLDIVGLVQAWRDAEADVALYLTRVEDPRAFGLVPTDPDGRVVEFLEKPETDEQIVTDQINAGCYVFKRSLIDQIPTGRPVSVEREIFPELLASGAKLIGVVDDGYWLDLGTPLDFRKGSCDLVTGVAPSPAVPGPTGESLLLDTASVSADATVDGGTVVGRGARIRSGAVVHGSVVFDEAVIGAAAIVEGCVVGRGAVVGPNVILRGVVVGDGARIGPGNELLDGARVFPGIDLAGTSVRFSSDRT